MIDKNSAHSSSKNDGSLRRVKSKFSGRKTMEQKLSANQIGVKSNKDLKKEMMMQKTNNLNIQDTINNIQVCS